VGVVGLTIMNAVEVEEELAVVVVRLKLKVPDAVGVPEIVPSAELTDKPVGSAPEVRLQLSAPATAGGVKE
jgi:hypothetical protein